MNKLNLKNINLQAPYTVHEREDKQHEFYFWTMTLAFRPMILSFRVELSSQVCIKNGRG